MRAKGNPFVGLLLIAVFWIGLMAIAVHQLYRDEQFDQSTHRSQAIVEHDWSTLGSKGGTHYHVRFHFIDDQNRLWTTTADDISLGTYRSLRTGVIVPVKYLAEDPAQSRIDWPNEPPITGIRTGFCLRGAGRLRDLESHLLVHHSSRLLTLAGSMQKVAGAGPSVDLGSWAG